MSNDWQPIETAPKDGTEILLLAVAVPNRGARYGVGCIAHEITWDWCWGISPTHWQPLPAPPLSNPSADDGEK